MNSRLQKNFQAENLYNQHQENQFLDFNEANSRSRYFNMMGEQSIKIPVCLSNQYSRHIIPQQQIDNPDGANTINFHQLAFRNFMSSSNAEGGQTRLKAQRARLSQYSKLNGQQICNQNLNHDENSNENENIIQNGNGDYEMEICNVDMSMDVMNVDKNKRKGLKYLSMILNKLLRRKKYDNNQIVNACIQAALTNENANDPSYHKQAQNIRRRIYDSINVMTAIGLVLRNNAQEMYIRKPEVQSSLSVVIHKEEDEIIGSYVQSIKIKQESIKNKKNYIKTMKIKTTHIKQLIQKNRSQNQCSTPKKPQLAQATQPILKFPLVFLTVPPSSIPTPKQILKQHRYISIRYKNEKDINIFCQMDALKYLNLNRIPQGGLVMSGSKTKIAVRSDSNKKQLKKLNFFEERIDNGECEQQAQEDWEEVKASGCKKQVKLEGQVFLSQNQQNSINSVQKYLIKSNTKQKQELSTSTKQLQGFEGRLIKKQRGLVNETDY